MQNKTILELFSEKLLYSSAFVDLIKEVDCDINLRRLEEISYQVDRDTPYLLNRKGREMIASMGRVGDVHLINNWLHKEGVGLPPLELLCALHQNRDMEITTFLYYKPEYCARISCQLVEMVTTDFYETEELDAVKNIVKLILSSMINVGAYSLRELFALSSSLMESFASTLVDVLFGSGMDLKLDFLRLIIKEKCAFEDGIKSFAPLLLNSLLKFEPTSVSFHSALSIHHKQWTSQYIPEKFKALYKQLEMLLTKEGVIQEVELIMEDGKANLKHLLYIISLMSQHSDQSDHLNIVKANADKWFKEALNERNEYRLGLALIITRHHFAEISNYFISYANWFTSIQAKNVLTLNFFFEFLSKLVPYEPAVFLKVQVTKVPSGPTTCQDVISDYISLSKTKLLDMNQTYDYVSLFNDFHETIQEQQESDVRRVVNHYLENGEVTKAVLEASVFRKQYYEKIFLPSLLSLPRGTDTIRDQLIIKLNTLGKLPSSQYRIWSKSRL